MIPPMEIQRLPSPPHNAAKARLMALDRAEPLPPFTAQQVLGRFWMFPSFAPYRMYCVATHAQGFAVRRGTWDQREHHRQQLALPEIHVAQLYRETWSAQFPAMDHLDEKTGQGGWITVDGIACGCQRFEGGESVLRYAWAYNAGRFAKPEDAWLSQVIADLDSGFPALEPVTGGP